LKQEQHMPAGRPTSYNADIADRICMWIAEGKSLRSFCRQDETPGLSTVCLWIVTHPQFMEQYAHARQAGGYAHADDIIDIADMVRDGLLDPNAARVILDAKKWSAERMAPKGHMPQSLVNHQSPDGSMSPKSGLDISMLSKEAKAEILAAHDALGQGDD